MKLPAIRVLLVGESNPYGLARALDDPTWGKAPTPRASPGPPAEPVRARFERIAAALGDALRAVKE